MNKERREVVRCRDGNILDARTSGGSGRRKVIFRSFHSIDRPMPEHRPLSFYGETAVRLRGIPENVRLRFKVASLTLVGTIVGTMTIPSLVILMIPAMLWSVLPIVKDACSDWVHDQKIGFNTLNMMFFAGGILSGSFLASSLALFVGHLSRVVLSMVEDNSKQKLVGVFRDLPRRVWLIQSEQEVETSIEKIRVRDVLAVQSGEIVPVDGTVINGHAMINQHCLTGESQLIEAAIGTSVLASTLLVSGKILVRVEKAGADTVSANLGCLLESTIQYKNQVQEKGQKFADQAALPTIGIGIVTLLLKGLVSATTVLNSCVGLYMRVLGPLGLLSHLGRASQEGILIKDGRSLQLLGDVDTVVFDKTGTLTTDESDLSKITCFEGFSEPQILQLAATAEARQSHPIATAIVRAAQDAGVELLDVQETECEIGFGVKATLRYEKGLETAEIRVGSAAFLEAAQIEITTAVRDVFEKSLSTGVSAVLVARQGLVVGIIEFETQVRAEAAAVVEYFKQRQTQCWILTGDREGPTRAIAARLGIENYVTEALPEEKSTWIKKKQSGGQSICFVGDGINDTIALKSAHVSVSLQGASTAATDTAQIVLMRKDLNLLVKVFELANCYSMNLRTSQIMTTVPGVIAIAGVYLLNFSIFHSIILNNLGLLLGVSNSLFPSKVNSRIVSRNCNGSAKNAG